MKRLKVLSLAALVAFAACDEGTEPVVAPPVTGTVSGVVTIEGAAASGVSVALSNGASATTDGSGAYSFAGVNAGAYTVTISGFASDATFSSTTKAATVTTTGQVVTVNFDGAYVRTAAIIGSVTAGGKGLAGVKVTVGSVSANTDGSGQFAFGGLRKGTYTVTISGFDAGQYAFGSTSQTINLGVGETKVAPFTGTLLATASINGTVTIDGTAVSGVTATLSTGAVATTNAAGAYSFGNLTAGNYTVTISGFAADAQFESVAKPVVITSAGSTVTANFAGSYIKTASITGTVSVAGGTAVAGVKVTLSNGATVNTDANGQYAFSALRGGTYTVTISGWNAGMYTFATTSFTVTVATGESSVKNFAGDYVKTAVISGSLFIDEVTGNGTMDSNEETLKVAGITLQAEGGAVNQNVTTTTMADGTFKFEGLAAGTYRVTIQGVTGAPLNAALPTNVAFRAGTATNTLVTVGVGETKMANWPFTITRQGIRSYVMLGVEGAGAANTVGTAPVPGATVRLYNTYANAVANVPTVAGGLLGAATTNASGMATFNFARTSDIGPSGQVDNIVFAAINTLPANHVLSNTDAVIEIKYNPKDSLVMAPDTFDAIHNRVVLRVKGYEIDMDTLKGWTYEMRADKDSVGAGSGTFTNFTNNKGELIFDVDIPTINGIRPGLGGVQTFPDTLWFKLAAFQGGANGHGFAQVPEPNEGTAHGSYFRYIWNGLTAVSDTIELGSTKVRYTDADIVLRAHREQDDTVNYTKGDGLGDVALLRVTAWQGNTNVITPGANITFLAGTGEYRALNFATQRTYSFVATPLNSGYKLVSDTAVFITPSGANQVDTINALKGSNGHSAFAFKSITNLMTGTIQARDGTAAAGISVRIKADDRLIFNTPTSGAAKDTTVVTNAAGFFTTSANLLEGPYTVTVADQTSTTATGSLPWAFWQTLTTTNIITNPGGRSPSDVAINSGSANNTDMRTAMRDLQGYADNKVANFLARLTNTKIQGVVVNDRDSDFNTLDPDEALAGVTVELFADVDSSSVTSATPTVGTADGAALQTVQTDATGAFEFTGLTEGYYLVRAQSPSGATVLRTLAANGTTTNTVSATTRAAAGAGATLNQNYTRNVGNKAPAAQNDELPRWNYLLGQAAAAGAGAGAGGPNQTNAALTNAPTHFIHLFSTGRATGKVVRNVAGFPAVSGVRVTITRCQTAAAAPSPPVAGACTTKHGTPSPHIQNIDTDATGTFNFTGLLEGVYQVDVFPASAGLTNINSPVAPGSYLLTIQGNNDVETTPNFIIS